MAALAKIIRGAGFAQVTFSGLRYDTFSDAPQASSAAAFGTRGVNIAAIKPLEARVESTSEETTLVGGRVAPTELTISLPDLPRAAEIYDAGALGCSDGPLTTIAAKLRAMPAGAVLEVRSTDPGVVSDLPAWCRMVGHTFLGGGQDAYQGRFFIRRKDS